MRYAIAVDGGNSKTDLALLREDGDVTAVAHGEGSSPYHLGVDGALGVIERLLDRAVEEAGVRLPVDTAELLLAGVDFTAEEVAMLEGAVARGWASRVRVDNDTFAVLRAGTNAGWGVAIVCGAGINCVGVAPDGRHARFPALGWITGDWGGGDDVGQAAISAAARSEDGRGPTTTLEQAVPAHFGFERPSELAQAIHFGRFDGRRARELAPVVFTEAARDEVAAAIVDRLAAEIASLARIAIVRLGLERQPVEVLLGGGLLRQPDERLLTGIRDGLAGVGPAITARSTSAPPILGASLLALDALGARPEAYDRTRRWFVSPPEEPVPVAGADHG